jgi:hypothetical protein
MQTAIKNTDDPGSQVVGGWSATRKLELRSDIPASHMGSRSTTPLLRNPTDVRHCSQHAGANVDFGDEGAVDWAFLGKILHLTHFFVRTSYFISTMRNS